MNWWIYKCNSSQRDYQKAYGDWRDFFNGGTKKEWGSTEWIPKLIQLKRGDMIIAYQTNRRELVGLAKVRQPCGIDPRLYLDPIELIGKKVPPLKKNDPEIEAIPALQGGPIKTLYSISESDALLLLNAAGSKYAGKAVNNLRKNLKRKQPQPPSHHGGGFGDLDNNLQVEKTAIELVTNWYRQEGWTVRSVEREKCGFDLRCMKGDMLQEVEVKGIAGKSETFIVTAGEVRQAKENNHFVLCIVTATTSSSPKLSRYSGSQFLQRFKLDVISYRAVLR